MTNKSREMNILDNQSSHVKLFFRTSMESERMKRVLLKHLISPRGYDKLMEDLYPEDKYETLCNR